MTDRSGKSLRGRDERGMVFSAYTYSRTEEGQPAQAESLYAGCLDLGNGNVLRVRHYVPPADYEAQAMARDTVLSSLVDAGQTPGRATPQATPRTGTERRSITAEPPPIRGIQRPRSAVGGSIYKP